MTAPPDPPESRKWDAAEDQPATPELRITPDASVVLVGNGPSVLRAELGPQIDAHDEIVRFNAFRTVGFEPHTGTRTTLWSTFGRGMRPGDDGPLPERVLFIHGEKCRLHYQPRALFGIPRRFYNEMRAIVQECSTRTGDALKHTIPSSGLLVTAWLLNRVGIRTVNLIGFDHFSKAKSGLHHYWVPQAFGRPKEHDGDAEARWMAAYSGAGRVRYLAS